MKISLNFRSRIHLLYRRCRFALPNSRADCQYVALGLLRDMSSSAMAM